MGLGPDDLHGEPAGSSPGGWDDGVAPADARLAVLLLGRHGAPRLGRAGRFSQLDGILDLEGVWVVVTLADGQKVAAIDADGRVLERLERTGMEWTFLASACC